MIRACSGAAALLAGLEGGSHGPASNGPWLASALLGLHALRTNGQPWPGAVTRALLTNLISSEISIETSASAFEILTCHSSAANRITEVSIRPLDQIQILQIRIAPSSVFGNR